MALEKLTENVEIVQTLGVYPNQENGLTGPELQQKFDEGNRIIKQYLNELVVPAVNQNAEAIQQNKEAEDATLGDHAERLAKTENDLRDHKGRIEQLEQVNSSHNEALSQLSQQAADTEEAVAAHGNRLDVLETTTAQHGAQLLEIMPRLERASIIDDSTVGTDTWSSKNIVDKLCPAFTESGSVAVCEPVEGYSLEVISKLPPKAYSTITMYQTGKNLLTLPYAWGSRTASGITFTVNKNGSITINGTATAEVFHNLKNNDGINFTGQYTITGSNGTAVYNGYALSLVNGNDNIKLCNTTVGVIYIRVAPGATFNNVTVYPQIEKGVVVTEWESPRGQKFTADLTNAPEVAFDGYYNWNTGYLNNGESGYWHDPETGTFDLAADDYGYINRNIPAMSGTNCFYSDCGDTEVKGKTSPATVIDKLTNAIIALGGTV